MSPQFATIVIEDDSAFDTRHFDDLGRLETQALFQRWNRDGDRTARDELVRRHLPLARKLAGRYRRSCEPFDDLMQVAALGLVKAVDRFRPELGNHFSSFAVPTIVGELKRHFRDSGWCVHVPRKAKELALTVERARSRLTVQLGHEPSVLEIADDLSLSLDEVLEAMEAAAGHFSVSLDAPTDDQQELSAELRASLSQLDEDLELVDARLTWSDALSHLAPVERQVVTLRFGGGMTLSEVARRLGCSRAYVSRVARRATAKLSELVLIEPAPSR